MKKLISSALSFAFAIGVFAQGSIIAVNPNNSQQGKSLIVTVTGSGTQWNTGSGTQISSIRLEQGSSVIFGANANAFTNTLCGASFNIPQNANTGKYDVSVSQGSGTIMMRGGFTITSGSGQGTPKLTSVSPKSGQVGTNNLKVTITGLNTNLNSRGQYVALVQNGSSTATIIPQSFGASSTTMLEAYFNLASNAVLGQYDVVVQNATDGLMRMTKGFTVTGSGGPGSSSITSIAPNKGQAGTSNLKVTITGSNTVLNTKGTYVALVNQGSSTTSRILPHSFGASSTTMLDVYFNIGANAIIGKYDVIVRNVIDGFMSVVNGFTVESATTGGGGGAGSPATVNGAELEFDVNVYPVPVDDYLNVSVNSVIASELTFTVHDLRGAEVLRPITQEVVVGKNTFQIDLSEVSSGSYYVVLKNEGQQWTQHVIVD